MLVSVLTVSLQLFLLDESFARNSTAVRGDGGVCNMAGSSRDAEMTTPQGTESEPSDDEEAEALLPFYGEGADRLVVIRKTAWKRLVACIGIKIFGKTQKAACTAASMTPQGLRKGKWLQTWDEGCPADVLMTGHPGPTPKQMTPDTVAFVVDTMKKRKMQSGEVLRELGQHRTAEGDERPLPCKSTMNDFCRQMGGTAVLHIRLLIKTPWHSRWRLHFAETWLEKIAADPELARKILFSDEKKFCLWDKGGSGWIFPDEDGYFPHQNVARDMNDAQYIAWVKAQQAGRETMLPTDKQHGKFPIFVWGALGYNFKSKLVVIEGNLTAEKYQTFLKDNFLEDARKWAKDGRRPGPKGRGQKPKFLYVQDNDPKHNAAESRAYLVREKVEVVVADRLNEDGDQDTEHHTRGPRANQLCFPTFAAYSPDINALIEKAWRFLGARVKRRCGEIKNTADMNRVIQEEWERLAFDDSQYEEDGWIGINGYVDKWKDILEEVVKEDGWDTRWMR